MHNNTVHFYRASYGSTVLAVIVCLSVRLFVTSRRCACTCGRSLLRRATCSQLYVSRHSTSNSSFRSQSRKARVEGCSMPKGVLRLLRNRLATFVVLEPVFSKWLKNFAADLFSSPAHRLSAMHWQPSLASLPRPSFRCLPRLKAKNFRPSH